MRCSLTCAQGDRSSSSTSKATKTTKYVCMTSLTQLCSVTSGQTNSSDGVRARAYTLDCAMAVRRETVSMLRRHNGRLSGQLCGTKVEPRWQPSPIHLQVMAPAYKILHALDGALTLAFPVRPKTHGTGVKKRECWTTRTWLSLRSLTRRCARWQSWTHWSG